MPARSRFLIAVRRKSCGIRPGTPALRTAVLQARRKLFDGTAVPVEEPRDDAPGSSLDCRGSGKLSFEHAAKLRRQREHPAALAVLGLTGLEAQPPRPEVGVMTLPREQLVPNPPAGDVGGLEQRAEIGGPVGEDPVESLTFEESLADILLLEEGDVRLLGERDLRARRPSVHIRFKAASSRLIVALAASSTCWRWGDVAED
jgi:hypothetical protein